MSGVNERLSEFSNRVSRPVLRKPVKFVYSNGLVQQVFAEADDPDWSVNMKKGIINMVQVDVQGKDSETGLKDFFTKEEVSIVFNFFFIESFPQMCFEGKWLQNRLRADKNESRSLLAVDIQGHQR